MHYSSGGFAVDGSKPTISRLPGKARFPLSSQCLRFGNDQGFSPVELKFNNYISISHCNYNFILYCSRMQAELIFCTIVLLPMWNHRLSFTNVKTPTPTALIGRVLVNAKRTRATCCLTAVYPAAKTRIQTALTGPVLENARKILLTCWSIVGNLAKAATNASKNDFSYCCCLVFILDNNKNWIHVSALF